MNAVTLGLVAALSWGTADVLARFAARRLGAYRALLLAQLVGAVALTVGLAAVGELAPLLVTTPAPGWGWGALTAGVATAASLAFYQALAHGPLALVAPIGASYGAITVLLALASGEALDAARAAGIAAALAGVVVAATPPRPGVSAPDAPSPPPPRLAAGVRWALAAALGFGLTFWLLGFRATPALGGVGAAWVLRVGGTLLLVAGLPALRPSSRGGGTPAHRTDASPETDHAPRLLTRAPTGWLVAAVGLLDTLGFVANNVGASRGLVSVVSVLGSLYAAVTVFVAWAVLGERLAPRQWGGVLLILGGVVLVGQ